MKKSAWFKTTLAVAIATVSSHSLANGLTINEQSASSMGTGFAGRSSSAIDASTVFGNPAGMSKLDRAEVSGGFAVIDASTDISGGNNGRGTNDGDMVPLAAIPFGYYVRPLNDKMHFGLGMYAPFGVISDYEDTFAGRSHGLYSKVQVITLQPTLSYQINDRVSVGFGPTINKIDGKLTSSLPTPYGTEFDVNIKGDDYGYGFNVGILVDVTNKLAWGLTYHSKVEYELEGRTRVTEAPAPFGINGSYDATLDFTSPESVDTSITYQLDDKWTLHAGTTWTRWSQLQEIVVENEGVSGLLAGDFTSIEEPLNWNDTWSFAFGAAYQLNPQWVLRTGFALDESPTTDADRTVRIPVGDRKILSLGAGWNATDDLTVDVAYAYLREDKSEVHQGDYHASYRNTAHGLSTQVTYRF
ncbi:OmpP1/FadL family transporter [Pseudomonas sp. OIL-1]|uniref:OmpP1/FadL family transporter n=1 Tax=Pseudomonas sp. OIL-1 TaxID=2706126 RepID=UPI0013A70E1C|nr:outer membrane protein transport protein [Pseudomonas sp. OIL-1]QIB52126.1 transporter [Pseudomonas sp. OIL-1]